MYKVYPREEYLLLNGQRLERIEALESCRQIFMNDEYVVKIEWGVDRYGMWQCRNEYKIWNNLNNRERKFFVPILYFRHKKESDCIIQPRLNFKFYKAKSTLGKYWNNKMKTILSKYGLIDLYKYDARNWGVCDGKPLIFDYGC